MSGKNYTRTILVIILFLIAVIYLQFSTNLHGLNQPAEKGHMDLSNQDLEKNYIALDGEWEFYPGKITSGSKKNTDYISVPGRWNYKAYGGKKMTAQNHGTYQLHVRLPQKGIYSFNLRYVSCAYDMYINGQKVTSNGKVGASLAEEAPTWRPNIISYYAESTNLRITLQVSNYHHNKGGIINSILFGSPSVINNNNILNIIKSGIIIGIFIGVGIYLILLYQCRGNKFTYLYLGLFCISSLIVEAIVDDTMIYYVWKNIPFTVITKLEFISYIGENVALHLFLNSIFPRESNRPRLYFIQLVNFLYFLVVCFTPITIFGYKDMIYIPIFLINIIIMMITLLKAVLRRYKNAQFLLIGIFIMVFTVSLDYLSVNNFIGTYSASYNYILGILVFLILQMYVISNDTLDAFKNSAKAKDMEIAFLQAQIAPHFFFNTLNNIYCLMETSVPKARSLIIDFSNFLRSKYKFEYHNFYSLKEELDFVRSFIKIENERFLETIELNINIPEEYLSVTIPQLLIQPIIENSIKHGFCSEKLSITISGWCNKESLCLKVCDNGKGMGKDAIARIMNNQNDNSGIGLKNINYRLMKCYQKRLKIESEMGKGTCICFEIPLEVRQ